MTQLRQLGANVDRHFFILRRYLRLKNAPSELMVRIVRCVEHGVQVRAHEVLQSDVQLLQFLSTPLTMELQFHVYAPLLLKHPFLKSYTMVDRVAMHRACLEAVSRIALSPGDILFAEGYSGKNMYFLQSGRLHYYPGGFEWPRSKTSEQDRSDSHINTGYLDAGVWFCESSLWCEWTHFGTMIAVNMAETLALDMTAFEKATRSHRLVAKGAQRYGSAFVQRLNEHLVSLDHETVDDVVQLSLDEIEVMASEAFAPRKHHHRPGGGMTSEASRRSDGVEPTEAIQRSESVGPMRRV